MLLPVNALVATKDGTNGLKLWHYSHYDVINREYHVFVDQKTLATSNGATVTAKNIIVVENPLRVHDGLGTVMSPHVVVIVHRRNGKQEKGTPDYFNGWLWRETPHDEDIIAYQILGDRVSQPDLIEDEPQHTTLSQLAKHTNASLHPEKYLYAPPVSDTKYDQTMMNTAYIWGLESKCRRLKVGAILAIEGRIIMNGYNGTIAGTDNCCEEDPHAPPHETSTKEDVLHAEHNLTLFCKRRNVSAVGATMYITASPCSRCAELIAKAGVVRVVYSELYRDTSGIEALRKKNIRVDQVSVQYDLFNHELKSAA